MINNIKVEYLESFSIEKLLIDTASFIGNLEYTSIQDIVLTYQDRWIATIYYTN